MELGGIWQNSVEFGGIWQNAADCLSRGRFLVELVETGGKQVDTGGRV